MFASHNPEITYNFQDYLQSVAEMMASRGNVFPEQASLGLMIWRISREANKYVGYNSRPSQVKYDQVKLNNAIFLLNLIRDIFTLNLCQDELETLLLVLEKIKLLFKGQVISEFDLAECDDLVKNFRVMTVQDQFELARDNLEKAISLSGNAEIAYVANNIVQSGNRIAVCHQVNLAHVTRAFIAATRVVESPNNDDAIAHLRNCANHFGQRSWGKMLAGTMLALAGVAMAVGFTAVALVSFGALAPVSILGLTVGASMLAGGCAVAGGAVGLGAAAAGAGFFASGARHGKESRQLRSSIENLAKPANRV